ncbi:MAG: methyl-accepting chemotaxis protein [Acetatifactor sp.]|nr:methyl-accepting chemotaxis protein [Acetatifactor sp.]
MRGNGKIVKVVATGVAFALILSMFPTQSIIAAPDETTENVTEETDAQPEYEVLRISTVEEFVAFAEQCYLDSWSVGKYVILEQDIDLSGVDFGMIPIFGGIFDGNGYTISGFHSVGDGYVGGLFRYIAQSGTVKNLKLRGNVEGTEEKECIGSICGVNYGTIRNCSFVGSINGRDTVGGIAGTNAVTGFIVGCDINGHVAGYYMTGGIVGTNHGTVSWCYNHSGINDDSNWVEEDDEMGSGLLLGINSSDSNVEFYSGVDTGGIAGYSDGTISNCFNYGKVGYEHTGYNIGGIVGRQAGVVSLCVNTGEVYGRKDVGGIVGQMEPYIEVDEAESLRNAVNKLHDLIGRTLEDLQAGKNAVKADLDNLNAYGDGALNSGHDLANQLTDFADTNVKQIHELSVRMDYIVSQMPAVVEDLSAAGEAFEHFSDMMDQAVKDAGAGDLPSVSGGDIGKIGLAEQEGVSVAVGSLQEGTGQLSQSADRINGIITNGDGSVKEWSELTGLEQQVLVSEMAALAGESQSIEESAVKTLNNLSQLDLNTSSDEVRQDLEAAMDYLQSMADSMKNATNRTRDIVNYLSKQPKLKFVVLGDEFNKSRENLYGQLRGISDSLKSLSQNASDYSDLVNADLKAVNDQMNVVFNLLADNLSGYNGLSVEELYEEVSDDEIDFITTGRADSCTNKGVVKGDINIGGIAGSMAIDEEDPEDNAAGSIDYEIGRRFIMKCIIQNCVNEGYITAKKDGAGGIVGYMAHGIVIGAESYGSVESTEGDYVGGICGESLTVIRRCFSLCDVSGGKNVGGIAGYANTLKDCYAIVNVEAAAGRKGAIAGQIAEQSDPEEGAEANVCRNYYVDDVLYGIDNISYVGIAEPVSYQELLAVEGIPGEFRHLKVIYRVEDMYLGTEEVAFGESLAGLHYPEIPAKEGCYGVWPDHSGAVMNGNLVIQGEYHDNVRVVVSDEKDIEDTEGEYQKPYALVEQAFTEDTVLKVKQISLAPPEQAKGKEHVMYEVSLENSDIEDGDILAVRLLNPYKNAQVWGLSDGVWTQLESKNRGQYLQVNMTGSKEIFGIVKTEANILIIVAGTVGAAALLLLLIVRMIIGRKKKVKQQETTSR